MTICQTRFNQALTKTAAMLLFLILYLPMHAQDPSAIANEKTGLIIFRDAEPRFTGLWEVLEVTAGGEVVTPTAKWFEIRPDGTADSGNGGVQNIYGSWRYDTQQKQLLFSNQGKTDENGPFSLSFGEDKMIWERQEEGVTVKVMLRKTSKKPLGPWDKVVGLWKSNEEPPEYFFMRWDRRYVRTQNDERSAGVWHIAAHSPELTLFRDPDGTRQQWLLTFENGQMVWHSRQDSQKTRKVFTRADGIDE